MCMVSAWDNYVVFKTMGSCDITKEMRGHRGKRKAKILRHSRSWGEKEEPTKEML